MPWSKKDCLEKYTLERDGPTVLNYEQCYGHGCAFCGWNPKINEARRKQLRDCVKRGETPHADYRP